MEDWQYWVSCMKAALSEANSHAFPSPSRSIEIAEAMVHNKIITTSQ